MTLTLDGRVIPVNEHELPVTRPRARTDTSDSFRRRIHARIRRLLVELDCRNMLRNRRTIVVYFPEYSVRTTNNRLLRGLNEPLGTRMIG